VIVQNFRAWPGTKMADAREPTLEELRWTIACARLVLPPDVSVQAPPNLNPSRTELLLASGINDFGGISPVTPDYINPDRPWPEIARLGDQVSSLGFELSPRLPIYDAFAARPEFLDPALRPFVATARARLRRFDPPSESRARRESSGEGASLS